MERSPRRSLCRRARARAIRAESAGGEEPASPPSFCVTIQSSRMPILTQFLWLAGLLVEFLILVRAIQIKSLGKYPLFYVYIAAVLGNSMFLYVISFTKPSLNVPLYWVTQFITLALGCGVIIEVSSKVFGQNVSLNRFTRWVMAIAFGTIILLVLTHSLSSAGWNLAVNTADLERYLRMAQAVALMTIVLLAAYYGIEIGRNARGLILGLGVYVGTSVLTLALRLFIGTRFTPAWRILQSSSYLAALAIWAVALWSYEPSTLGARPAKTDRDYQIIVGRTQEVLGSIGEHLDRTSPR